MSQLRMWGQWPRWTRTGSEMQDLQALLVLPVHRVAVLQVCPAEWNENRERSDILYEVRTRVVLLVSSMIVLRSWP